MKELVKDRRGSVAIEFALVGPMLMMLVAGIISYGGYFWIAHATQQVANDAARAAAVGLESAERRRLALESVSHQLAKQPFLGGVIPEASISEDSLGMTVSVAVDGSKTIFWVMKNLAPLPNERVIRSATVRLGGY